VMLLTPRHNLDGKAGQTAYFGDFNSGSWPGFSPRVNLELGEDALCVVPGRYVG
jgi:hypothetical protein